MSIYAVDFDGYLCEDAWPNIGPPHMDVIEHFKQLREEGNKLILWTCREGEAMARAVIWCAERGLHFDAINANLPERVQQYGNDSRKVGADYYCDDKNYVMEVNDGRA